MQTPPTPEMYTLSLHDALPIFERHDRQLALQAEAVQRSRGAGAPGGHQGLRRRGRDRKSTRLNSSHVEISYAVFCLKKKMDEMGITSVLDLITNYPRRDSDRTQ